MHCKGTLKSASRCLGDGFAEAASCTARHSLECIRQKRVRCTEQEAGSVDLQQPAGSRAPTTHHPIARSGCQLPQAAAGTVVAAGAVVAAAAAAGAAAAPTAMAATGTVRIVTHASSSTRGQLCSCLACLGQLATCCLPVCPCCSQARWAVRPCARWTAHPAMLPACFPGPAAGYPSGRGLGGEFEYKEEPSSFGAGQDRF